VRTVRLGLVACVLTACGPITIHSERHTHIESTITRCDNPEDAATCHEVHESAAPAQAP
jgi:hypothetical protein